MLWACVLSSWFRQFFRENENSPNCESSHHIHMTICPKQWWLTFMTKSIPFTAATLHTMHKITLSINILWITFKVLSHNDHDTNNKQICRKKNTNVKRIDKLISKRGHRSGSSPTAQRHGCELISVRYYPLFSCCF